MKELRALFYDLLAYGGADISLSGREEFEAQIHRSREVCEQLQRQLTSAQDLLKHKNDEVNDITAQVRHYYDYNLYISIILILFYKKFKYGSITRLRIICDIAQNSWFDKKFKYDSITGLLIFCNIAYTV
jgi:hypothetical protein